MSARPDPDAFANLLCDWCLDFGPEQQVQCRSTVHGLPLVRALHAAVLERDAWPLIRITPDGIGEAFYRHARERHLDAFAPLELLETQTADAVLGIAEQSAAQARIIERLSAAREIHIEAPGTDLRLRVDGRSWINSDGKRRDRPRHRLDPPRREDRRHRPPRARSLISRDGRHEIRGVASLQRSHRPRPSPCAERR
jgi:leucyl aminopeptidase (aminopeptidase T)